MDQQYETELASHRDWASQEFSIRAMPDLRGSLSAKAP
jgi:hypothetical protein